jgi:hypothetical protein
VRFQILRAACMKMNVLWAVAPCSVVEVYRRFRGACCLHHQVFLHHRPDDVGSKHLWNVGKCLPDYTAQQLRIQSFSYSALWEPQISKYKLTCSFFSVRERSQCENSLSKAKHRPIHLLIIISIYYLFTCFSWYFSSWTSGQPHHSGLKFLIVTLSL